jgi:ribosomal protein S8E
VSLDIPVFQDIAEHLDTLAHGDNRGTLAIQDTVVRVDIQELGRADILEIPGIVDRADTLVLEHRDILDKAVIVERADILERVVIREHLDIVVTLDIRELERVDTVVLGPLDTLAIVDIPE